jgi:hypothetical protein
VMAFEGGLYKGGTELVVKRDLRQFTGSDEDARDSATN